MGGLSGCRLIRAPIGASSSKGQLLRLPGAPLAPRQYSAGSGPPREDGGYTVGSHRSDVCQQAGVLRADIQPPLTRTRVYTNNLYHTATDWQSCCVDTHYDLLSAQRQYTHTHTTHTHTHTHTLLYAHTYAWTRTHAYAH